ncbi:hypothetical protein Ddye_020051 [Dipteronia dyeriana]|uniref:BED-type domain-containing protein n=1 Tax=Dipteronia dyeriana TaxID=168575 RepID=A0AAD9TZU0_9ROSI|nr:hypothetical protein Ddye_020051 [Dipteronia dyeriana]
MSTPHLVDEDNLGGIGIGPSHSPAAVSNKRKTSEAWKQFKKQKINGKEKAVCTLCNAKLVGGVNSGTSHLLNHIKICPMRKQTDIRQYTLANNKTEDGKDTLEPYTFDPIVVRRKLAEMIILHEYPLRMVEHDGFREYSIAVQPLFKLISRNTIKRHILQIYDMEKEKTISVLEANRSRISITTDMWTSSNQKKGFMMVTMHFIDDSWVMPSLILRYHTSLNFYTIL